MQTTAKSIKVTLVLDPTPLAGVEVPAGKPRFGITVAAGGRTLHADLNAKSARRAIAAITTHGGPVAVTCILTGRLEAGDMIAEAGIVVVPKAPATQAAA